MSRQTISLALLDKHPVVGWGVQAMLAEQGAIELVHHALRAQELFDFYKKNNTELLLLDLNLPDMDHKDMVKNLRQQLPATKIMAFTAYNNSSLVKTVLRLGLDGYLLKSCTPEMFRNALHELYTCDEVYVGEGVQLNNTMSKPPKELKDSFQKRLSLSKREKEILGLISQGYTSQSISEALFISKYTVETHRKNILRKLNFNSSTELVRFAVQQGLVQ
ncbi:MAG: response regulator transcription factor [Bacteroidota bacterium]